jgi:hypothetical protein
MLELDVADVQTVARPAARSPDTRAAVAYLVASGATAVSVIETGTGRTFRVGTKIDPRGVAVHWLPETRAKAIVRLARKHAGTSPDIATAETALHRAAADPRVTLTAHHVAMTRAGKAAQRLDAYVESLRARGAMREFTKAYRRHRLAAMERGEGYMSFKVAELRLRRALIPLLMNNGQPVAGASLFAEIFNQR